MRIRSVAASLLLLLVTTPLLAAFDHGDVLLEERANAPSIGITTPSYDLWEHFGWSYALQVGFPLLYKTPPFTGPGHFLAPATNQIVFHSDRTVSVWDGVAHVFTEPGLGYTEIFHDDAELGEIAPMSSGNFLVPEVQTDGSRPAKLIQFNLGGRVAEYAFPDRIGATHIELLSDHCTLLYGRNDRIGRLNLCTRSVESDFAVLPAGTSAGAIRQLPTGDVLVAGDNAILQFTPYGSLVRSWPFPGVTHIALATDGKTFWAAGVDAGRMHLRGYDPARPDAAPTEVPLGNPEMQSAEVALDVSDLVVVGEWRAASFTPKLRTRAARP